MRASLIFGPRPAQSGFPPSRRGAWPEAPRRRRAIWRHRIEPPPHFLATLHAHPDLPRVLANLGNLMRTLAMPKAAETWPLTSLREKLIKIGAKVVSHGRYVTFS